MSVLPLDYDSDPERWGSWQSPQDVHETVAPELSGPVLDVGCGQGRLASLLDDSITWIGVDSSPAQLAENPFRPVVRADMAALPFRDGSFAEVTHLWCLYHLDDPLVAVAEAWRVLQPGGRYYACTSARNNDPEIMPEAIEDLRWHILQVEQAIAEMKSSLAIETPSAGEIEAADRADLERVERPVRRQQENSS